MAKNPKMIICRNCNNPMSAKEKMCPSCGAKNTKPFYKRGWFIILAAIVVIGIIGSIGGNGGKDKIKWSEMELGTMIPKPPSSKGTLYENSDEQLWVSLEGVTDAQYNDYLDDCIAMGFTIDADKDSYSYKAYNDNGYCLDMSHIGKELSINLEAPMKLGSIAWPTGAAGKLIPTPKSTTGKFSFEHDDNFCVYVGDTSKADYDEYVAACSEAGFHIDYDKGETYYRADNADGYHVSVTYEGNKIMLIRIDAPDEEDATETVKPEETPSASEIEPPTEVSSNLVDGMRPEFKEAMDSYEKFMGEYCAFMKKYSDNPSDLRLLADYAKFMSKYADFVENFDKWDDGEMNTAEAQYYLEVQTRVNQKLLEVAG